MTVLDYGNIDRLVSIALLENLCPSRRVKKRMIMIAEQQRIPFGVFTRIYDFQVHG
jgi:hypothetical protein